MDIKEVGLEALVSYFPDQSVRLEDRGFAPAEIPPDMSFPAETPRFPAADAAEQMAEKVSKKALAAAGVSPAEIDLVIIGNLGGQFVMPGLATDLHRRLGCRRDIASWNMMNCCASVMDGIEAARRVIAGDPDCSRALVVGVSAWDTGGWGSDQTSVFDAVVGDGAAAAIVSGRSPEWEILGYANHTWGELYDSARVDFAPPEHPSRKLPTGQAVNAGRFHMVADPAAATPEAIAMMKGVARAGLAAALGKARVDPADVDLLVVHMVTDAMVGLWQEDLADWGIPADRWRTICDRVGNTGPADVPATLAELAESGELQTGMIVATYALAGGGHAPATILRWRGRP